MRVRQNPKGSADPARHHLDGPRSGYDRLAAAPMEALLGHISLDRVIWIESMAEEPAARHQPLAVRGEPAWGGGFAAYDEVRSDARRLFRAQLLGQANRISVPRRCRSSTIVQDRIWDTSGTLVIGKVRKSLI
jgi:hypothetical protein